MKSFYNNTSRVEQVLETKIVNNPDEYESMIVVHGEMMCMKLSLKEKTF